MKDSESDTYNGKTPIGVPEVQANMNLEWDTPFVDGLALEGRVIYTGSEYVNQTNSLKIPSWTRYDIGARYALDVGADDTLTFRLKVENLTDEDYWAAAGGSGVSSQYLVQGDPRTFVVSASYDF